MANTLVDSSVDPFEYCKTKAKQSASNFLTTAFGLSLEQKNALYAVYAFCREIDDIVDEPFRGESAEKQLNFWENEIRTLETSHANHPITNALKISRKYFPLEKQYFLDNITGMRMDLDHQGFETLEALKQYCYYAAGSVGLLVIAIFGYQNSKTEDYARHLGQALQFINIIRDVKEDFNRNRIYLPKDLLKQHDASIVDFKQEQTSKNLVNCLKVLAEESKSAYETALSCLSEPDLKSQKPGLIMAKTYFKLLEKIEENKFQVLKERIVLSKFQKLLVAMSSV